MKSPIELLPKSAQAMVRALVRSPLSARGFAFSVEPNQSRSPAEPQSPAPPSEQNPLERYFQSHDVGRGIWKWEHYLRIYHRHFQKFIGQPCRMLEIGIFSGGSLEMWRDYLGPRCEIVGVDIAEECRAYETEQVRIYIGDQGNRDFWGSLKSKEDLFDIIVDDGSHFYADQVVTFEEMISHLRPGGVYLCEDVHGTFNKLADYMTGFAANLNDWAVDPAWQENADRYQSKASAFQRSIHSVHLYPFVVVVERAAASAGDFFSQRKGTLWKPTL